MTSISECESLLRQGDRMFSQRGDERLSLWQELARNFHVERADFITDLSIGKDFSSHLSTSAPLAAHRELTNIISTTLRPEDKDWFQLSVYGYESKSEQAKRWLQSRTNMLRRAMYDRDARFSRAMKEADGDIACFGNAVISCEMNWYKKALLFRTWHLRDVAWCENSHGDMSRVERKWKSTAAEIVNLFPETAHENVRKCLEKEPDREVNVRHTFMDAEYYNVGSNESKGKRYVSIYYDCDNKAILEKRYTNTRFYVIPRWATVSGSQYGYSPPTMKSLPDARLMQDMMTTVLEAGQMAVAPPHIAVMEAIRSEIDLTPNGITTVDADYDERLGEVLRPVGSFSGSVPIGLEMLQMIKASIDDAHFINKIGLPPLGGGMSPYEVSQRVADYIRNAMPLLSPLEDEYNGGVCSLAFDVLFENGGLGKKEEIPEDLLGENIDFKFTNPLRETRERAKGNMLSEAMAIISQMSAIDNNVQYIINTEVATRDTLNSIGADRDWFRTEEEVSDIVSDKQEQEQLQSIVQLAQQGGDAAQSIGQAAQSLEQIRM